MRGIHHIVQLHHNIRTWNSMGPDIQQGTLFLQIKTWQCALDKKIFKRCSDILTNAYYINYPSVAEPHLFQSRSGCGSGSSIFVNADPDRNWTGVTYGLLYGNAPLWSEKANGPVVRRLELDPLLCYAAELGQRHHLKSMRFSLVPRKSRKSCSVWDPWHFGADPYLWLMDPTPFFSEFKLRMQKKIFSSYN